MPTRRMYGVAEITLDNISPENLGKIDAYLKKAKTKHTPDVVVKTVHLKTVKDERGGMLYEEVVYSLPNIAGYASEDLSNFYAGFFEVLTRLSRSA